jgi:hypothetical protein
MIKMNFFFVLSFIYINLTYESYIVYPFKKSTKEKKSYPENLLQNDLEITLKIGTPPQSVDLNLRSRIYTFFVTSSQVNLPYKLFNEKESTSLVQISKRETNFTNMEYSKGLKISESIYINDKELKGITLMLGTELAYNECGALGLRLINSHESSNDLSFIYQIKKYANLDSYTFTLKYKNDEEGDLIIGAYPHVYDNKFNEKNFFYSKAGSNKNGVNWVLNFDIIKYNNKSVNVGSKKSLINIEYGLIQAPFKYKNYFKNNFYGDRCSEKFNDKRNVTIVHCSSNFDITSFKDLIFELKDIETQFVFTYKDLFIKENNEYIFGIVFDEDVDAKDPTWIFGKPFMKKYELVYDLDRKIIGLYKGNNTSQIQPKKNPNLVLIILLGVLGIVVIGLIIFIIYYFKKPRKNRACELNDDNYEYFPTE